MATEPTSSPAGDDDDPLFSGVETTPIDALIAFSRALDTQPDDEQEASIALGAVRQANLMLLDYRRLLEGIGLQMRLLPSLVEREEALAAYQGVCQRVVALMATLDAALKDTRREVE